MNNSTKVENSNLITPILVCGCLIVCVSFAIRSTFGVFQIPIAEEFGWPRMDFSFAIAIQNLAWGIGQPFFGALAERMGDRIAIILGAIIYAIGLVLSSVATTPEAHQLLEFAVGLGIAGTGFGVILAVVGRASSDKHRSMSLGIATAAGSGGQIIGPPVAEYLLGLMPWQTVFLVFAGAILLVMVTLPVFKGDYKATSQEMEETIAGILKKAFGDPSFTLIFVGFFSCGYQLALITAHFPAFVTEFSEPIVRGGFIDSLGISTTSSLGAVTISLIGLANIFGTLGAGWLGTYYSRKWVLTIIYTLRAIFTILFLILPFTPFNIIWFSLVMGFLWLATVPLTSGLIGHIYGLRYMATLYGIIFFSHQLGGFIGVWLGGFLYDRTGNYDMVWWIGVGVATFSAIVHIPINEIPLSQRLRAS
ncbi:MAG: MFS transporter [Rhodobacteraceae bacterium]|nr:MFS transporter [Paracoccaceae bacterium]